uniref:Uncharacterized protein n=1 Tax=Anopheles merus TaxID=30066 RepID=A0A182UXP7_ANOME
MHPTVVYERPTKEAALMLITPLVGRAKASSMEIDDQKGAKKHATPDAVQFRHPGSHDGSHDAKVLEQLIREQNLSPGNGTPCISALWPGENNEPPESHEFNGQIVKAPPSCNWSSGAVILHLHAPLDCYVGGLAGVMATEW